MVGLKTLSFAVVCLAVISISGLVFAGAPAGDYRSIDPQISKRLKIALWDLGYLRPGQRGLKIAARAFLWDHRKYLVKIDYPKEREIDILVCLLSRHGDRWGFRQIYRGSSFGRWCRSQQRLLNRPLRRMN